MSPLIIPILGISCGLLAIFGGVFVRPWFAYKQRRMELDAALVAEKAAQYAAHTDPLEHPDALFELFGMGGILRRPCRTARTARPGARADRH